MARKRVIGADNKLPWHLSADLKRFRALTMGHHIIMGRKTFESIGRILPGRTMVVVTRNPAFRAEGAVIVDDFDAAILACRGDDEIFITGGEALFAAALPIADRIYLTEIDRDFEGNVRFPPIDVGKWRLVKRESHCDPAQDMDYVFATYDRI
jgi:dihydrofolate reductase